MELGYYVEDDGTIGLAIETGSGDYVFIETDDVDVNYEIIESAKKNNVVSKYLQKNIGGKNADC